MKSEEKSDKTVFFPISIRKIFLSKIYNQKKYKIDIFSYPSDHDFTY